MVMLQPAGHGSRAIRSDGMDVSELHSDVVGA